MTHATHLSAVALGLLVVSAPLRAQETCPHHYSDGPARRIEVHIFQPSCDTPLLPDKRALGRVWAFWPAAEGAGETDSAFRAIVTVTDGAGKVIVRQKHTFHRPPWDVVTTAALRHTVNFALKPTRGGPNSLKVTVEVDPDEVGPGDPRTPRNIFPDPGVASWTLVPAQTFGASGERRVLRISYVAPQVGEWKKDGGKSAQSWLENNADAAEAFVIQNLPVHAVHRTSLRVVPFAEPEIVRAACTPKSVAICVFYKGTFTNERVENRLAREFIEESARSIVVMFLPPGYAGDQFRGKTFFPTDKEVTAAFSGAGKLPATPVIVLPTDVEPWVLAHEMTHVFLGKGHVELPWFELFDRERNMPIPTGRSQGIHAFRIPLGGYKGGGNKHTVEGNSESSRLMPLMKSGEEKDGILTRFISDRSYQQLLEAVSDAPKAIWALSPVTTAVPTEFSRADAGGDHGWGDGLSGPSADATRDLSVTGSEQAAEPRPHLLIGGAVGPNGTATLDRPRFAELRPRAGGEGTGPYRVELRDRAGGVLSRQAFSPIGEREMGAEERVVPGSTFALAFSVPERLHTVVLLDRSGRELARRERSSGTTPNVSGLAAAIDPGAGTLAVRWESAGSADSVTYDVSYAADGKTGWTVIGRSAGLTSITVPSSGLRRGPDPRIRVVASNGFDRAVVETSLELRQFDVVTRFPASGDVVADDGVWITLNTDLAADARVDGQFTLRDASGRRVPATSGYDRDASRLWLAPNAPLEPGTTYRATVSGTLRDRWGRTLGRDVSWSVRTAPDTESPRVLDVSPRNGDITIAPDVVISIAFSEPLADDAARPGAVRLADPGGTVIDGAVRFDSLRTRLVFTPSSELQRRTTYTLTLDAAIADLLGNRLGESAPVTFTTAGRIVPGTR